MYYRLIFGGGGVENPMSGPLTRIARERSDRAGEGLGEGGGGYPPFKGRDNFTFGARKTVFSHSRRINKAPCPRGVTSIRSCTTSA